MQSSKPLDNSDLLPENPSFKLVEFSNSIY